MYSLHTAIYIPKATVYQKMIQREMKLLPSCAERINNIQTFQTLVWDREKTIT